MPKQKYRVFIPVGLGVLIIACVMLFAQVNQVNAQCGSQASSCKNCHETQGQKPVNNDGKGWHTGHAFGDFCYACHGGNNQSMDKASAHAGMVDPMSDVKTACQSCHPNDLTDRAQKYATILGIQLNLNGQPPAGGSGGAVTPAAPTPSENPAASGALVAPALVVENTNVIDYNQRYAETVEGKTPINWGNWIVAALIVLVLVGGGVFVYYNERKLRGWNIKSDTKTATTLDELPVVEGYSQEVVALLPMIARLNPMGLYSLKRVLENPEQANDMLHSLAQLDPDLVKRIRSLDRDSRSLLLAVAGD